MSEPLTVPALMAALHDLAPLVEECRAQIDAERGLPLEVFSRLKHAGVFRLWLPRRLGGPELSPADFMSVVEAAARLDGSVGWVVGNGAGASRIAGYLEDRAARALLGEPGAFMVTATGAVGQAIATGGGYRVTGRWPFGSGLGGATSVCGLCTIKPSQESAPPRMIMCCVPIDKVSVIDTWDVSGLRGTGSHDWTVKETFVPAAYTFDFPAHRATEPGFIYRMPVVSTFTWSVCIVPLALAQAVLDAFVDIARTKVRAGASAPLREREMIQVEVGRAEAAIRTGRAGLLHAMATLQRGVEGGEGPALQDRVALRLAATHAAETAVQVAAVIERLAGTAAILETLPIARRMRDLRASAQHVAMSTNNFLTAGRLKLGVETDTSRI